MIIAGRNEEVGGDESSFGLEELVARANRLLPQYRPDEVEDGRVRDQVNPRLVRHLTTLGLLDETGREGREARYTARHLLQLLVVRRLMAEGHTTGAIKKLTQGANDETLEELLQRGSAMLSSSERRPALPPEPTPQEGRQNPVSAPRYGAMAKNDFDDSDPFADEGSDAPDSRASEAPPGKSRNRETAPPSGTSNPALDYLASIRAGTSGRAGPAPATRPALFPPTTPTPMAPASDATNPPARWVHIEIEPGLELHVREDFRPPPTPHERDELLRRIGEQLKAAPKSKPQRKNI